MKKIICVIFIFCVFIPTCCLAATKDDVICILNERYYSTNWSQIVDGIDNIDKTIKDDEYIKRVFCLLDAYSKYYTKNEYENGIDQSGNSDISALISNDCITVKINRFDKGIDDEFTIYMNIVREKKINKLILDLTDCPGGYISVMCNIAQYLLPKGEILTVKFKNSEQIFYSELNKCPFDQITVLVSSKTASAAEILAADLQESKVAIIIGVNTYGKASVQEYLKLENGGAMKFTCGKYLTRDGKDIANIGVIPDVISYKYPVMIKWNAECKLILNK